MMSVSKFSHAEPAEHPPATPAEQTLTCPTCGARQVPSETCRRCQTDLRMVLSVRDQYERQRQRCLALLASRRLKRATVLAQQCLELSCDEASVRLSATCYLLQGNFLAALQVYARFAADER